MTQQLSAPGADTSARLHQEDGQLSRSEHPACVRALEEHQAGLAQMLAEPSP